MNYSWNFLIQLVFRLFWTKTKLVPQKRSDKTEQQLKELDPKKNGLMCQLD